MAVIITFLSNFRNRSDDLIKYKLPVEGEINGYYTNDAPLIYLSRKIAEELPEEKNIKLVAITSYEVFTKKAFSEAFEETGDESLKCRTLYEYYEKAFSEKELYGQHFFTEDTEKLSEIKTEMCMIPYGFYFNGQGEPCEYGTEGEEESLNSVCAELVKFLDNEKYIYIDYAGGLRNIQYFMASLTQFFEMSGMQCKQIVYSMLSPSKVVDIKNIYDIGRIVQAVSDFTETGSVKKLEEIFGDSKKYGRISELVLCLDRFVKSISIGRVDELDEIRAEIKKNLDYLDSAEKTDVDLYSGIFMTLIPKIKESFYMKDKDSSLSYTNIIKWCLAHRFVQQAATVYVEKIPSIYIAMGVDKEKFGLTIENKALGSSEDSTLFFHSFWGRFFPDEVSLFAQKLADGMRKRGEKPVLEYLAELSEGDGVTLREKKALELLADYIENYTSSPQIRFGTKERADTKSKRLGFMLSKGLNRTSYCLLNNCNDAPDYIREADGRDDGNSYKAQKAILKKFGNFLQENGTAEYKKLYEIMKYYLAVKIIRNNMSHASLMSSEDTKFFVLLDGEESGAISYDRAFRIISAGISLTENQGSDKIVTDEMWDRLTEYKAV